MLSSYLGNRSPAPKRNLIDLDDSLTNYNLVAHRKYEHFNSPGLETVLGIARRGRMKVYGFRTEMRGKSFG